MSMNLRAVAYKEEIKLWKTPTHISYMCCMNHKGEVVVMRGKDAKRALYMYCAWVRDSLNGVYEFTEILEENRRVVEDHINYILQFINDKTLSEKNLMVFVM